MRNDSGRHIGLFALLLTLLLTAGPLLAAAPAQATEADGPAVRMAVDPTVLPPVGGPDDEMAPAPDVPADQFAVPDDAAPDDREAPPPPMVVDVDKAGQPAPPAPAATEAPAPAAEETPPQAVPENQAEAETPPAPAPPVSGPGGIITGLSLRSTPNGFELTLTADRPVGDTSYLNLNDPRRLVLDLRQAWTLKTRNVLRADSGVVRHVVVGEHPDRLRLVIHFRTPVPRGLEPEFSRTGNRLVVRVRLP